MNDSGIDPAVSNFQFVNCTINVETNNPRLLAHLTETYPHSLRIHTTQISDIRCRVLKPDSGSEIEVTFINGKPRDLKRVVLGLLHPPLGDPPYVIDDSLDTRLAQIGPGEKCVAAVGDDTVIYDNDRVDEDFLTQLLVASALLHQPDILAVHAAAVEFEHGTALLTGRSRAGKTTTSLHLAANGNRLITDELSIIRLKTGEVLPLPRLIKLRPGPRSAEFVSMLNANGYNAPDDKEAPLELNAAHIFPQCSDKSGKLTSAFFLDGFAGRAKAEPFTLSIEDDGVFDYMAANDIASLTWGTRSANRTLRLLAIKQLLGSLRCWKLTVGEPATTVSLIQGLMENV